ALAKRADRPLHVPEDLPHVQLLERDLPARELAVALEIRLDLADPAEASPVDAESPGAHERPRDVLGRIADVRELPVEDADETVGVHGEVAEPEVAVQDDVLAVAREPLPHPEEAEL